MIISKTNRIVFFFSAGITLLVWFLLADKVNAQVTLNPSAAGVLPDYIITAASTCDDASWVNAGRYNLFEEWKSANGNVNNRGPFNVNYGTQGVGLQINAAVVNCAASSTTGGVYVTNAQTNIKAIATTTATNVSVSTPGIVVGSSVNASVQNAATKGGWGYNRQIFSFEPAGGFTTSGTYSVTTEFTVVYRRSNGTYQCADGASASGYTRDANCVRYSQTLTFTVNVSRPMVCSNLNDVSGTPGTYVNVAYRVTNNSTLFWSDGQIAPGDVNTYRLNTAVVDTAYPGFDSNGPTAAGTAPDNGSNAWIESGVNGTANIVYDAGTQNIRRYGASFIGSGGSRDYSVRILIPPAGTTKTYGIRMFVRGATAVTFFGSNWIPWSSTCDFNVTGNLPPPPPTCNISNAVRVGGFTLTWSSTNATSASLDQGIGSVATSDTRNVGATGLTYTLTVTGAGGTVTCPTTTVVPAAPSCMLSNSFASGSYRVSWTSSNATSMSIDQNIGNVTPVSSGNINVTPSYGSTEYNGTATNDIGATSTCDTTITIDIPTCVAVLTLQTSTVASVPAGTAFGVQAELKNNTSNPITVSSATYAITIPAPPPTITSSNITGSATSTLSIPADDNQTYSSAEDIRIDYPGTFDVAWDIVTPHGTVDCDGTVTTTVEPLTCEANPLSPSLGIPFGISVEINNPNYIEIPISGSEWDLIGASPDEGYGVRDSSGTTLGATGGGSTIAAGNPSAPTQLTIYTDDNIIITTSGTYTPQWSLTSSVSGAGFSGCPTDTVTIESQPYARFYGNDVIAGGSFVDASTGACSPVPGAAVKGKGDFTSVNNHSSHVGMASELAIIATGIIERTLPGSQDTSRTRLDALSFANTTSSGFADLGGGFGPVPCADDYLDMSTAGFTATGITTGGSNIVEFPTAASNNVFNIAETTAGSTVTIRGQIDGNQRFQVYVNGDVIIEAPNPIYTSSGGWTSIDDIPLLRVYATGNIYIDSSVSEINGLLVARGTVHTCTGGSTVWNASTGDANILANCRTPLRIVGSVITNNIDLKRTNFCTSVNDICSYGTSPGTPEPYDSSNIAESFIFSPELYLALLSLGSSSSAGSFDSLLSLPPAF